MTGSEFAFLAMGLALGVAIGAAIIEVLRVREAGRHDVRVTVTPDAVPRRRSATLADQFVADPLHHTDPARGGPGDRTAEEPDRAPAPVMASNRGTSVLSRTAGVAHPVVRLPGATDPGGPAYPLPVAGGLDPMLSALRASAAAGAVVAMHAGSAHRGSAVQVAEPEPSAIESIESPRAVAEGTRRGAPPASEVENKPGCSDARRLADERCTLAERARAQASTAEAAHRSAQRTYDEHETAAAKAAEGADVRAIRRAKDEAQARFRAGRAGATTTAEVEAAARTWLVDINRINVDAQDALGALARVKAVSQQVALDLERTALDADVARISAETTEAACVAAREAVADCEERAAGVGALPAGFPTIPSGAPSDAGAGDDTAGALAGGGSPRIFRLLRGDRMALQYVVGALAGDDPAGRRHWQTALSELVHAIVADSVAASALEFPVEHPFWGHFTEPQARDIATALSSLGFRFDGADGWVDERVPAQRDLSLAMGYAGLDPMRLRQWPTEEQTVALFEEVRVAADEHLASVAGDLSLGELVAMLGRRADALTDVWNDWGRIRPLLLEEV